MDIAGEHHVHGPDATCRGDYSLADPGRIERNRRRVFKNTGTRFLCESGETKSVVVRVDVKGLTIINRAEISWAAQLIAHALDRPEFDVSADPAYTFDFRALSGGIVCFRHMQPPIDQLDARHPGIQNCAPDVVPSLFREPPKLLGMIETNASDDAINVFRKSRKHKAQIAA